MPEVRNHLVVIIFTDDVRLETGHVLERQTRMRAPDANVMYVDPDLAKAMLPSVVASAQSAGKVVVAVYVSPTAGKIVKAGGGAQNSVSMPPDSADLMRAQLSGRSVEQDTRRLTRVLAERREASQQFFATSAGQ